MIAYDLAFGILSQAGAGLGALYVHHLVRVSGRDRPVDPARVERLVARAPVHRVAGLAAE